MLYTSNYHYLEVYTGLGANLCPTYTLIDHTVYYCKIKVFPSLARVSLCLLFAVSCVCRVYCVRRVSWVYCVIMRLLWLLCLPCLPRLLCLCCHVCCACVAVFAVFAVYFTELLYYAFAVFAVFAAFAAVEPGTQIGMHCACMYGSFEPYAWKGEVTSWNSIQNFWKSLVLHWASKQVTYSMSSPVPRPSTSKYASSFWPLTTWKHEHEDKRAF